VFFQIQVGGKSRNQRSSIPGPHRP